MLIPHQEYIRSRAGKKSTHAWLVWSGTVLDYSEDILSLIGNTPLVKLGHISKGLKPLILAKLEFLNPGGSIKDRIGMKMITDAEKQGLVKRGGTIIEPSSGNTGVGLALAANLLGYKLIVTMPDKMSVEKKRLLEAYGARVIVCPTDRSPESPENYLNVAKRVTNETPNSYMPNQYANPMNPLAHYETTGPEIWRQTDGKVSHLVIGMGTGGTISGISRYLKEKNKSIRVVGVDPVGSILQELFKRENKLEARQYKIEGIGEDFLPKTTDLSLVDEIVKVTDREAYLMARRLAKEESLLTGSSSGAVVAVALKVAALGTEKDIVVTLLPDRGDRYLTKLYNDEWMREQGFL
jgi:cystathionine beta-synthase